MFDRKKKKTGPLKNSKIENFTAFKIYLIFTFKINLVSLDQEWATLLYLLHKIKILHI